MNLIALQTVGDINATIPAVVGAAVAIVAGVLVGGRLGTAGRLFLSGTGVGSALTGTPLGRVVDDGSQVDRAFGTAVKYYVYLVAVLVAADLLGLSAFTDWVADALRYVPALVGGVALLALGLLAADYATDIVADSETVAGTPNGVAAVRAVLYFIVIVVALDTAGANVRVVTAAVGAVSEALIIAIAIVVGLAIGLDRTDKIRDNIDELLDRGREDSGTTEQE